MFTMAFLSVIKEAFSDLQRLYPGFNPIQFHLAQTARLGESVFNAEITDVESVFAVLETTDEVDWHVQPGRKGAVCFVADIGTDIGLQSVSRPLEASTYTITPCHGDLVAAGPTKAVLSKTSKVTFVLTPEWDKSKDDQVFALASVYPGEPDPAGDWEGLKEGDTISGSELLKRSINRVKEL